MEESVNTGLWSFIHDGEGTFESANADKTGRLYYPLMNEAGLKSSVTPELKGDISASFDKYLTPPVVTEELHRTNNARYFWLHFKNNEPWCINGLSPSQQAKKWSPENEETLITARPGSFVQKRQNRELSFESEISITIPAADAKVELWKVTIRNLGESILAFTPFVALPLFGRHADNLRDHRQVTTMFQYCYKEEAGVVVKPSIVHDESGHRVNQTSYFIYAFGGNGELPRRIWTRMNDFTGEGGSMANPEAVFKNLPEPEIADKQRHGVEAIGAMSFPLVELQAGDETSYIVVAGVTENNDYKETAQLYNTKEKFDKALADTHRFWAGLSKEVKFKTGNPDFDEWAKWLAFQLKCRQIFGNSFLPDFGYGRGGRGWRDLWQDLLSIFLVDPESARNEIINNLKGVRIDGSNATIIGNRPGEFRADRNNIPRTWCDHGAWPLFALNFYIQQSGDIEILFDEIEYWKDQHVNRSKYIDESWSVAEGNWQKTGTNHVYRGSILEHVLIQQLSAFYNVGEHNILKLEGADWNDTLDMARNRGESVCFQNFYAGNLAILASLLKTIKSTGKSRISLLKEIEILLDRVKGRKKINYNVAGEKQKALSGYFDATSSRVSGSRENYDIDDLIIDLMEKYEHSSGLIRSQEWISSWDGNEFFNGHYDDLGCRMHGRFAEGTRMDLTSQVMPVMFDIADDEQVDKLYSAARKILATSDEPGLRLCTRYPDVDMNIGRITGFVYGYKEHGSKWMQQNIMFMYGLLKRDKLDYGHEMLADIFDISTNSAVAKTFPGIASFYEPDNRGAYMYLTGSSTWLFLSIVTQVFGLRGENGDLLINPKLTDDFLDDNNESYIELTFRRKRIGVKYTRVSVKKAAQCMILTVKAGNKEVFSGKTDKVLLNNNIIASSKDELLRIDVSLG